MLSAEFEHEGFWFLPGTQEKSVAGTLHFAPESGARLELLGSLKDVAHFGQSFEPAIVLGIDSSGKPITLLRCYETSSQMRWTRSAGMTNSTITPTFLLIGIHFERQEDVAFDFVRARFGNLDQWAAVSGFHIELEDSGAVIVRYKPPASLHLAATDEYVFSLDFTHQLPSLSRVQTHAAIQQRAALRIEAREPTGLQPFLDQLQLAANFLDLAVGESSGLLSLEGTTSANEEQLPSGKTYRPPVEIAYQLSAPGPPAREAHDFEMVFTLSFVRDRIEVLLGNWLRKADLLGPVYSLYFGTVHNPQMYLHQRFLSLVQGLESYHRRTRGSSPDEEHRRRLAAIADAVPGSLRPWLEERLRFSHEPTLRTRLNDLLNDFLVPLSEVIRDQDSFVQRVVATRNYFTHLDEESGQLAMRDPAELFALTERVRGLLAMCLFSEIGFTKDDLAEITSGNSRFAERLRFAGR